MNFETIHANRDKIESLLFVCSENSIRSPIASSLTRHICGASIYTRSAGIRHGERDLMAIAVMKEFGADISQREPRSFEELSDGHFDMMISLSEEARDGVSVLAREKDCGHTFWDTADPSLVEGNRDQRLEAYRDLRETLTEKIIRELLPYSKIARERP